LPVFTDFYRSDSHPVGCSRIFMLSSAQTFVSLPYYGIPHSMVSIIAGLGLPV